MPSAKKVLMGGGGAGTPPAPDQTFSGYHFNFGNAEYNASQYHWSTLSAVKLNSSQIAAIHGPSGGTGAINIFSFDDFTITEQNMDQDLETTYSSNIFSSIGRVSDTKIVAAQSWTGGGNGITVTTYDVDGGTGALSNKTQLDFLTNGTSSSLDVSPDGNFVAVAYYDGTNSRLFVYDFLTSQSTDISLNTSNNSNYRREPKFMTNSTLVVGTHYGTIAGDLELKLFDVTTGSPPSVVQRGTSATGTAGYIHLEKFTDTIVAVCANGGTITAYDVSTGNEWTVVDTLTTGSNRSIMRVSDDELLWWSESNNSTAWSTALLVSLSGGTLSSASTDFTPRLGVSNGGAVQVTPIDNDRFLWYWVGSEDTGGVQDAMYSIVKRTQDASWSNTSVLSATQIGNQSSASDWNSVIEIADNKWVACERITADNNIHASVFTLVGDVITSGTSVNMGSAVLTSGIELVKVAEDKFALVTNDGTDLECTGATVSGLTITKGTLTAVYNNTALNPDLACHYVSDDVIAYHTSLSTGGGASGIVTWAGTTPTEQVGDRRTYTITSTSYWGFDSIDAQFVDTNKIVVCGRLNTNTGGVWQVPISISGQSMTIGTPTAGTIAAVPRSYYHRIVSLGSGKYMIAYIGNGGLSYGSVAATSFSTNGSTVTDGVTLHSDQFNLSRTDYTFDAIAVNPTEILFLSHDSTTSVRGVSCLSHDGTNPVAWSKKHTLTYPNGHKIYADKSMVSVNSTRIINVTGTSTNDFKAHIIDRGDVFLDPDWADISNTSMTKLRPATVTTTAYVGSGMDINSDGTRMVAGSFGHDSFEGKITVFEDRVETWTYESDTAQARYGTWVAMNGVGDTLFASRSATAASAFGYVEKWTRSSPTSWTNSETITPDSHVSSDGFGRYIACSDDASILVVGSNRNQETIHVFEDSAGYSEVQTFQMPATASHNISTLSLSSDGTWLLVGATNDSGSGTDTGVVFLYERVTGTYTLRDTLRPSSINASMRFGQNGDVSDDGTLVACGAKDENNPVSAHGSAYLFAGTPASLGQILHVDSLPSGTAAETGDDFGQTSSISGDGSMVVFASPRAKSGNQGEIYIYQKIDGAWYYQSMIDSNNTAASNFGEFVKINDDKKKIFVSSIYDDTVKGSVYEINHIGIPEWHSVEWNQNYDASDAPPSVMINDTPGNLRLGIGAAKMSDGRVFASWADDQTDDLFFYILTVEMDGSVTIDASANIQADEVTSTLFADTMRMTDNLSNSGTVDTFGISYLATNQSSTWNASVRGIAVNTATDTITIGGQEIMVTATGTQVFDCCKVRENKFIAVFGGNGQSGQGEYFEVSTTTGDATKLGGTFTPWSGSTWTSLSLVYLEDGVVGSSAVAYPSIPYDVYYRTLNFSTTAYTSTTNSTDLTGITNDYPGSPIILRASDDVLAISFRDGATSRLFTFQINTSTYAVTNQGSFTGIGSISGAHGENPVVRCDNGRLLYISMTSSGTNDQLFPIEVNAYNSITVGSSITIDGIRTAGENCQMVSFGDGRTVFAFYWGSPTGGADLYGRLFK